MTTATFDTAHNAPIQTQFTEAPTDFFSGIEYDYRVSFGEGSSIVVVVKKEHTEKFLKIMQANGIRRTCSNYGKYSQYCIMVPSLVQLEEAYLKVCHLFKAVFPDLDILSE